MPATTCFFRLTSSEFSDSLKKHDLRPNSGCFLLNHFYHLARAIRRRFERRAARVVDSTITFNKRQFQTRIEFEPLQFFFTWDCFPATPSSQVATLLLICSSVCLQNIHINSHLLWIFFIRANLRKVLISMDSSDSSRIL